MSHLVERGFLEEVANASGERTCLWRRSATDGVALDEGADEPLPIRRATSNVPGFDGHAVTDRDPETWWITPEPQQGGEEVVVELEGVGAVSAVSLATGPALECFPRWLTVSTSIDGTIWEDAWSGGMAGAAVEAVLKDPRIARSRIAFPSRPARLIRLRHLRVDDDDAWVIAELAVYGRARP